MKILNEIDNLILTIEQEGDFIDRHKGKLLLASGLGLAHSGYLGPNAQGFVNKNAEMIGHGVKKAANWLSKVGSTYPIPGKNIPWIGTTT